MGLVSVDRLFSLHLLLVLHIFSIFGFYPGLSECCRRPWVLLNLFIQRIAFLLAGNLTWLDSNCELSHLCWVAVPISVQFLSFLSWAVCSMPCTCGQTLRQFTHRMWSEPLHLFLSKICPSFSILDSDSAGQKYSGFQWELQLFCATFWLCFTLRPKP